MSLLRRPPGPGLDAHAARRQRMVDRFVAARGVSDARVLARLGALPRHLFVDEALAAEAYGDHSLPIGHGQTISQPYIVGLMSELLALEPAHRVLEIGTGCGYQTAVLAGLSQHVYSIERLRALLERAQRNLRLARVLNVSLRLSDGSLGWPDRGPFDRILVTAAARRVPAELVAQLKPSGRLVLPMLAPQGQRLCLVRREAGGVVEQDHGPCSFVPLVGRAG